MQDNIEGRESQQPRSPAYPRVSLDGAIQYCRKIHDGAGRGGIGKARLAAALGISVSSGKFAAGVAALRQYGLLESVGNKHSGEYKLTANALRIVIDDNEESQERLRALRDVAFAPRIHRELWEKFGEDGALGHIDSRQIEIYLTLERGESGYNKGAAGNIAKNYMGAVALVKIAKGEDPLNDVNEPPNDNKNGGAWQHSSGAPAMPTHRMEREPTMLEAGHAREILRGRISPGKSFSLLLSGEDPTQEEYKWVVNQIASYVPTFGEPSDPKLIETDPEEDC